MRRTEVPKGLAAPTMVNRFSECSACWGLQLVATVTGWLVDAPAFWWFDFGVGADREVRFALVEEIAWLGLVWPVL